MDEMTARIGEHDALIYTKDDCVNCDSTKSLMDELKISYVVVNMDREPSARVAVKGLGFRQAPVVVTKKANWSGHREEKIRSLKGAQVRDLSADDDIWG